MPDPIHISGARIWTADKARPWATSITLADGRVQAMDGEPPLGTRCIDACGRLLAPGLIDAHVHLLVGGQTLSTLDLSSVRSREEFEEAIASRHADLSADQWLIANNWSDENWPGHEPPDKSWLKSAGERPVVCYRVDLHAALINDAVLERVKTTADLTRDPVGGRIARDADGHPTGLLVEAAAWQLVNPLSPESSIEQRRRSLLSAQQHAQGFGVTTVGSMEYARQVEEVFAPLRDELTLRCRITLLDRTLPIDFSFGEQFENDDRLAVIGYKAFSDGTLGSRTARMFEPYDDDLENRGTLVELAADGTLHAWAREVAARGFSPSIHAIGDEAARLALDVIDGLDPAVRPRIEHAQQLAMQDVPRFAGRIASMQPLHKADDGRYVRRRVGERRLPGTYAFRSLLKAGARLAFGSDWPVASCDPLLGIRASVTGLTFDEEVCLGEQNISVEQAMRAYTVDAAYTLGLDDGGVLRVGALADLVMFDQDPLTADWVGAPPKVIMTIAGGQRVYDAREQLADV